MKRFTLLVAVGVIFVFLLSSNFASRVGASKDKVHNAEPQVTNQAIKPSGTGETRPHSAKPARRNKFASLLADLGTPQTGTFTSGSSADVDDEHTDQDFGQSICGGAIGSGFAKFKSHSPNCFALLRLGAAAVGACRRESKPLANVQRRTKQGIDTGFTGSSINPCQALSAIETMSIYCASLFTIVGG